MKFLNESTVLHLCSYYISHLLTRRDIKLMWIEGGRAAADANDKIIIEILKVIFARKVYEES